jgi:Putative Flp pilus-assembly TadE/G-like
VASRRRRERGHAAVLIALGGVTLLAITGLAIDGGMAAGAFRHAQNAADAGALAAARAELVNAFANPSTPSTSVTLTPVADAEVQHNGATLGTVRNPIAQRWDDNGSGISGGYVLTGATTGSVYTEAITSYIPNGNGGISASASVADLWATANAPLQPVNAHLQLVGTTSAGSMVLPPPSGAGSTMSSQVDVALLEAPSAGLSGWVNCYKATAAYTAGADTTGVQAACPPGATPSYVTANGTLLTAASADAHVGRDGHPSAQPRLQVGTVNGQDGGNTVAAAYAGSSTSVYWDLLKGLTSSATSYATNVNVNLGSLSITSTALGTTSSVSVDSTGHTSVTMTCTPATVQFSGSLLGSATVTAQLDSSCNAGGGSISGVAFGYEQPAKASACTVDGISGVATCAYQTCLLHVSLPATPPATPYPTTLCLGQNVLSFAASPVIIRGSGQCTGSTCYGCDDGSCTGCPNGCPPGATTSPLFSQFTGRVTVTAQVQQPTYFLSVIGWAHTTPAATATADIEPVVDESSSAFAASPFAMPDTGTAMTAPFQTELLTVGHTYYIYGPSMQSDNPTPVMPATWQGQLTAGSAHRVGTTVTGAAARTTTPQPYLANGPYWLLPIFNPISGAVERYGVFVPYPGQPNWGTLVNSVPAQHGYVVQATSTSSGFVTYDDSCAVSIKLLQ